MWADFQPCVIGWVLGGQQMQYTMDSHGVFDHRGHFVYVVLLLCVRTEHLDGWVGDGSRKGQVWGSCVLVYAIPPATPTPGFAIFRLLDANTLSKFDRSLYEQPALRAEPIEPEPYECPVEDSRASDGVLCFPFASSVDITIDVAAAAASQTTPFPTGDRHWEFQDGEHGDGPLNSTADPAGVVLVPGSDT